MDTTLAEIELDEYLREYGKGSDECERRKRECLLCKSDFDIDDGVELPISVSSDIRVNGRVPKHFYICNHCLWSAEKIESEDY